MNKNINAIICLLKNIFKRSNRIYKYVTSEHYFCISQIYIF